MWQGFKFTLGACVAVLLVWGAVDFFNAYGVCAKALDEGYAPRPGGICEMVSHVHRPR